MAWWEIDKINCMNCFDSCMIVLAENVGKNKDDNVLWCRDCGAILNLYGTDPISISDWRVPKLCQLNDAIYCNSVSRKIM